MRHGGAEPRGAESRRGRNVSTAWSHGCGEDAFGETTADYLSVLGEGHRGPGTRLGGCSWCGPDKGTQDAQGRGVVGVALGAGEGPWGCRGRPGAGSGRCPLSSAPLGVLDCPAQLSSQDGQGDLGDPPATRPTVGFRSPAGLVEMVPLAVCKVLWVLLMETNSAGPLIKCNPGGASRVSREAVGPTRTQLRWRWVHGGGPRVTPTAVAGGPPGRVLLTATASLS